MANAGMQEWRYMLSHSSHPSPMQLVEVVMDLGRPPLARFPQGEVQLSLLPVSLEDLSLAVQQVGGKKLTEGGEVGKE